MSISEQSSNDLRRARIVLHKLGETFNNFNSHAFSIVALGDQWRNLQNSFVAVHNSLENRLKELEAKEIEIASTTVRFQNLEEEFQLRERSLKEKGDAVNIKEKQVKDWCEGFELDRRVIEERSKAVEVREKRFAMVFEKVREVEMEAKKVEERWRVVEVREMELSEREERCRVRAKEIEDNAKERRRLVEMKEKDVNDREERCSLREKEIEHNANELELRLKMNGEHQGVLEMKEIELSEFSEELSKKLLVLEQMEKEFEEKNEKLALKEEGMDEIYNALELKEKELNERDKKLTSQEKILWLSLEEVNEQLNSIESKEMEIVERYRVFELKEKEVQQGKEKMGLKEKEFNVRWERLETREKDVEEKIRVSRVKENKTKEKTKELNERYQTVELKEKQVDDRQHEMELKEKEVNDLCEKLNLKEKQVNESCKALELKEKRINKCCKDAESKEKEIDKRFQELETKEKQVNLQHNDLLKELELKEKDINDLCEMLESKEKLSKECSKVMKMKEIELMEHCQKCQAVESEERDLNEQSEALETKENHLGDDGKVLDCTEKQMNQKQIHKPSLVEEKISDRHSLLSRCQSQTLRDERIDLVDSSLTQVNQEISYSDVPQAASVDNSSSKIGGDIHLLCRNMDSDGVRLYLIEHVKELKLIRTELLDALRSAPNPGKLVLDVCQNLYRGFTSQAKDTEIGCIFLLEQLTKLSPVIALDVQVEATSFAVFWKARLKGIDTLRQTYGFLQFLAAFKLASLYGANELLSLFDIFYRQGVVYRADDNPYLCRALGLSKKIPGIIKSLLKRQEWLLAVKYICVFKLESNFPPVPLLEAHLKFVERRVNSIQKNGTFGSKIEASNIELKGLKKIVTCVTSLKLEQKFPVDSLVPRIQELEKARKNRKDSAFPQTKKRDASSCASAEYPDQQEKRPRMEDDHRSHHVAPLDYTSQPLPHHAIPFPPNAQPNWQQGIINASNGLSYNPHLGFGQLVPPGMQPYGANLPVYYG